MMFVCRFSPAIIFLYLVHMFVSNLQVMGAYSVPVNSLSKKVQRLSLVNCLLFFSAMLGLSHIYMSHSTLTEMQKTVNVLNSEQF